ncbi:MAG: hypothetical protein Q9167_004757 [Letrouitia subvulpina]
MITKAVGVGSDMNRFEHGDMDVLCVIEAARVTQVNEAATVLLLDELKNVLKQPVHWTDFSKFVYQRSKQISLDFSMPQHHIDKFPSDKAFLYFAVMYGAVSYVRARATQANFIQNTVPEDHTEDPSPLLVAIHSYVPKPEMVECLLDLGADPNLKYSKRDSQTPWMLALTRVSTLYQIQIDYSDPEFYLEAENRWKQTLKLMFLRGGHLVKAPNSLLTPISRKLLEEIRDEVGPKDQPTIARFSAWLGSFKLK